MSEENHLVAHSAEGPALGFYYQVFFALLTLLETKTDDAAVGIEQLDDVEIRVDGQTLLYQLKHSVQLSPPPISLKSKAFWRTVKVWVDLLPQLILSETTLHLVTVATIAPDSPLIALTNLKYDRAELVAAMVEEAERIKDARLAASKAGKALPYPDRASGCLAFLGISHTQRHTLMCRTLMQHESSPIGGIEEEIARHLDILPPEHRLPASSRLVEWWDRQMVYTLCDRRERVIQRGELQYKISEIISDIEQEKLVADFEIAIPPHDYQPDGMLARQVNLVAGKPSDLTRAIREEWKAREQRAKWLTGKSSMAVTINEYDIVLKEQWSDRHGLMTEECADLDQAGKCEAGLKILRWTHIEAPGVVRPISQGWNADYYIRGSYQILAINLEVGWHAEYTTLLGGKQ
jgi:hypothetical protein